MHGANRKRMRANDQEDIAMTEIADINYDFQETVRDKSVPTSSTYKNLF